MLKFFQIYIEFENGNGALISANKIMFNQNLGYRCQDIIILIF